MTSAGLSIGQVARRAGKSASAIRFYEQAGLLPKPMRTGGQRRYSETILDRLALLEYAKNSGFSLEEIRRLFHGSREGAPVSMRWQHLAAAKIVELNAHIERIEWMQKLLKNALKCRCIDVEECGRRIRQSRASTQTAG